MTIETTNTEILPANPNRGGRTVLIQNVGTVAVSLGIGAGNVAALTAANGVLLTSGKSIRLTGNDAVLPVSGIVASGTGSLRVNTI